MSEHITRAAAFAGQPAIVEAFGVDWLVGATEVDFTRQKVVLELKPYHRPTYQPEALTAAVWNGEGLPPVGCECEAYWGQGEYLPIKVLAHDEGVVVARYKAGPRKGEYAGHSDVEINGIPAFRPLRTAEQIAAEAREAEVDRLCKVVMAHPAYQDHNRDIHCSAAMRLAVEAIVDADA